MTETERRWFPAPAKINLYLKVRGRRSDGYHELDSVMARLELADRVGLALRPGQNEDRLVSTAPGLPTALPPDFNDPGNLALKALHAYRERTGWPEAGVDLFLEKNIPLGAGLGGGSSNGATVLTTLNRAAPAPLTAEELTALGLTLGADVPFFLQPRPLARAEGVGERLSDSPPAWDPWAGRALTLVNSGLSLSTGLVFKNLGLTNQPPHNNLGRISDVTPFPGDNDLWVPALKLAPALATVASAIQRLRPDFWGMSGSGSTFWFCPPQGPAALETAEGWWICETRIQGEGTTKAPTRGL